MSLYPEISGSKMWLRYQKKKKKFHLRPCIDAIQHFTIFSKFFTLLPILITVEKHSIFLSAKKQRNEYATFRMLKRWWIENRNRKSTFILINRKFQS